MQAFILGSDYIIINYISEAFPAFQESDYRWLDSYVLIPYQFLLQHSCSFTKSDT